MYRVQYHIALTRRRENVPKMRERQTLELTMMTKALQVMMESAKLNLQRKWIFWIP